MKGIQMGSMVRLGLMVAALALVSFALAGCEASVSTGDNKSQLEKIITDQLPGKLEGQAEKPEVEKVTCVEGESNKFDCIAAVKYVEDGKAKKTDLSIAGSCDSKSCIWETKN
jgi:hypothetical protein